ncbi:MAG: glycosyltransferase family 1 protein [Planctomycetota bacterium]
MRVLLDGYNLQLEQGTGVATYARSLSRLLGDSQHEVDVLYGRPIGGRRSALLREVEFFDRPRLTTRQGWRRGLARASLLSGFRTARPELIPPRSAVVAETVRDRLPHFDRLWNQSRLFEAANARQRLTGGFVNVDNRDIGADVAHWTYPLPLRLRGAANVYTVHDLVPLRLPDTTLDRKAAYLNMLQRIAQEADLIVTVSETSRADIIELLGADENRVVNTYQPTLIPGSCFDDSADELAATLHGIFGLTPQKYVLAYGAVEPKKNFGRLTEAYLGANLDMPLVIAGPDGWLAQRELALVNDGRRSRKRVIRIGYTPSRQLVNLIRGAACVAFPSLYEGFGLPILEAWRCGTPVLTSNHGATAEIADDAAALVDPYSVTSIRRQLRRLCDDADWAGELVARGTARLKHFSPEACAQRLADAYARLGLPAAAVGGESST